MSAAAGIGVVIASFIDEIASAWQRARQKQAAADAEIERKMAAEADAAVEHISGEIARADAAATVPLSTQPTIVDAVIVVRDEVAVVESVAPAASVATTAPASAASVTPPPAESN